MTDLAGGSYVVYECPLPDCPWTMRKTPTDEIPIVGPTFETAVRDGILAAKAAEESKLRTHLEAHTVENWVAAVVELDRRASAAERAGEVVATAERWKVRLPQGTLKGITEADADRISAAQHGTVFRQKVTLYADGGEYLSPWGPA